MINGIEMSIDIDFLESNIEFLDSLSINTALFSVSLIQIKL